ncbi:hypothetical protein FRUB_09813 [Fimbriiglobus ruber]|uniref:Uncharacterized protein n=2 Tax=Fimbriiglobus ruber TaxID=1908690 RepID=A0A225D056_9BACT|nr:hypothetical protein FRUB_09813 [Fimbriiglobus ruber]
MQSLTQANATPVVAAGVQLWVGTFVDVNTVSSSFDVNSLSSKIQLGPLVDFNPDNSKIGTVDVTHQMSLNSAKEKATGWYDGGDATFKLRYNSVLYASLNSRKPVTNSVNNGRLTWGVFLPDWGTIIFNGILTDAVPSGQLGDNPVDLNITIAVSGRIQFVPLGTVPAA